MCSSDLLTCYKIDVASESQNKSGNEPGINVTNGVDMIEGNHPAELKMEAIASSANFDKNYSYANQFNPASIESGINQLRADILNWKHSKKYFFTLWSFE